MALTADEKAALEELQRKAAEPDADENYEVELYDTAAGKGVRVPFSQAKKFLYENFGIGEPPAAPETDDGGGQGGAGQPRGGGQGGQQPGYFGRRTG